MKTLLKIIIAVVVLAVVAIGVLFLNLDRGIKAAVEEFGPRYTGSAVTLDGVNLSPFSGEGSLSGLVVANPPGFAAANALRLGRIDLALDLESLKADVLHINAIRIAAPEITFEKNRQGNNLKVLQQNVQHAAGITSDSNDSASEEDGRKMIIRELAITGGIAHYSNPLLGSKTVDVRIPDIHLYGIGEKSGGATGAEVAAQVIRALNTQVNKAIANSDAVKELTSELQGQLKDKESEFKGKLEGLKGLLDR